MCVTESIRVHDKVLVKVLGYQVLTEFHHLNSSESHQCALTDYCSLCLCAKSLLTHKWAT